MNFAIVILRDGEPFFWMDQHDEGENASRFVMDTASLFRSREEAEERMDEDPTCKGGTVVQLAVLL